MKTLIKLFALAVLLITVRPAAAMRDTDTQRLLSGYARKEPLRSAILGVFAMRGADTLAQFNRAQKMVPASNVKLLTTGLALNFLGPDMHFNTSLAYTGEIENGVLEGDLYIVGGGDPTIAAGTDCADSLALTFSSWKAILDEHGIKTVKGKVVGDSRFFKRPSHGMSWQIEDVGFNYGAGPSGLNFFENSQSFSVKPSTVGKAPVVTLMYPDTPWMHYVNSSVTGPARSSNTLYYLNTEFGPFGEFHGSFPADRKGYKLMCSNPFGAYTCAYFFHNYLLCNGILVEGGFADISPTGLLRSDLLFSDIGTPAAASSELKVLGKAESPELWRIIKDTNYQSDNFFAETLFNMLSWRLYGESSRERSEAAVAELMSRMDLRTENTCRLLDGSGLSRKDYVSPEFFVRFLKKMYAGPMRDYYLESLPSPGSNSTLKYRMKDVPDQVKSRVKMKSGSMNGVLCFSGYILPENGDRSKTVVFSILTNNVTAPSSSVAPIIEEIILSLSQEP